MSRIVLVDPLGDVLFSGESVIASGKSPRDPEMLPETQPAPSTSSIDSFASELEEPCPATMRSAGSGVYRAVDRARPRLRSVG